MKIFDKTMEVMEKSLDVRMKRHALLVSNVANAETPGYRARDLDFGGEIEAAMNRGSEIQKSNPKHMDLSGSDGAHAVLDDGGAMRADGNNVDLDLAMGKLAQNAGAIESTADYLTLKLRLLRLAARSGGGEG